MSNYNSKTPADAKPATPTSHPTCRLAKIAFWLGAGCWLLFIAWLLYWRFSNVMLRAYDDRRIILMVHGSFALLTGGIAVAAIVAGFKAGRLLRSDPALAGKGCARAGLLFGGLYVTMLLFVYIPELTARRVSSKNMCINSLRQIDGAKEQWALEYKKTIHDTPTWNDLVGNGKYLPQMPKCSHKGTLSINSMGSKPSCSVPGHTLP